MARSLAIEEERGTMRGVVHPHNGYYAGNFFAVAPDSPATATGVTPVKATVVESLRSEQVRKSVRRAA